MLELFEILDRKNLQKASNTCSQLSVVDGIGVLCYSMLCRMLSFSP